jgi:hypothetical protein
LCRAWGIFSGQGRTACSETEGKALKTTRIVGVIATIAAAGAILTGSLPAGASTTHHTVAASNHLAKLNAGKLSYARRCWGVPPTRNQGCEVSAVVPSAWKLTKLSTYHARFDDRTRTWMVRIDGHLSGALTSAAAAKKKQTSLRGVPGLKIISRATTKVNSMTVTTLTYTYRDGARGTRWVATRYVEPYSDLSKSFIEITVAGRPTDKAGLQSILTRATNTVRLAG